VSALFALALALLGSVSVASWPADGQVHTVAPDHVRAHSTTAASPASLTEPDTTPTPPAPAAAGAAAGGHLRTLFPGAMILALVGMSALTLRRQSSGG
jgi:hypothetical protein